MSDSSGSAAKGLEKLKTKQVRHLLELVAETATPAVERIRRQYLEGAQHFNETLAFLQDLRWIREEQGQLVIGERGERAAACNGDETALRAAILDALASSSSTYRDAVANYICKFKVTGRELGYRPSVSERARESSIRDLLMDLRAVSYRRSDGSYALSPEISELYVWAKNTNLRKSKASIARALANRPELGVAAELAALAFEKERVGPRWGGEVEHVSADSPFASYDIRSITSVGEIFERRYIEVKAISKRERRFFWSKGELEAALLLGQKYYLYLVPVESRGVDVSALTMIQDPYRTVYKNSSDWLVEQEAVVCTQLKPT